MDFAFHFGILKKSNINARYYKNILDVENLKGKNAQDSLPEIMYVLGLRTFT